MFIYVILAVSLLNLLEAKILNFVIKHVHATVAFLRSFKTISWKKQEVFNKSRFKTDGSQNFVTISYVSYYLHIFKIKDKFDSNVLLSSHSSKRVNITPAAVFLIRKSKSQIKMFSKQ